MEVKLTIFCEINVKCGKCYMRNIIHLLVISSAFNIIFYSTHNLQPDINDLMKSEVIVTWFL